MAVALAEVLDIPSTIHELTVNSQQLSRLLNEFNQLQANPIITGLNKQHNNQRQYKYTQQYESAIHDHTIPVRTFAELDHIYDTLNVSDYNDDTIQQTPKRADGKTTAVFVAPSTGKSVSTVNKSTKRVSIASPIMTQSTPIHSTHVSQDINSESMTPLPATIQVGRKSMARRHTPGRDLIDEIQDNSDIGATVDNMLDDVINDTIEPTPMNISVTSPAMKTPIDSRRSTRKSVVSAADISVVADDNIDDTIADQTTFDDNDQMDDDVPMPYDDTAVDDDNDKENTTIQSNIEHNTPVVVKHKPVVSSTSVTSLTSGAFSSIILYVCRRGLARPLALY